MKSFFIERVQNGWIVHPYGNKVRDDRTQASVFSTLPDLIGALPVLFTEPVISDVCPTGIQLDIKPQWDAAKPAHLFNCPDCGHTMSHADREWSCHRCQTTWKCDPLILTQSSTGPEE